MTDITQSISSLDPTPDIADPSTFEERMNAMLADRLPQLRTEINTWKDQANTMAGELAALAEISSYLVGGSGSVSALVTALGMQYPMGQCVLAKSGSNLVLSQRNGNRLLIDGVNRTIPSAGVTLAPTGLLANTLYYIYAYMSSGVMTLEASPISYSIESVYGTAVKSGNAARALVGMAYCKTAATFTDTNTQRLVRSWFNDPGVSGFNGSSTNTAFATAPYAEISSAFRAEFIQWSGEQISLMGTGVCFDTSAFGGTMYLAVAVDSTVSPVGARGIANITNAGYGHQLAASFAGGVGEGYHYVTLLGGQTGCTAPNYSGTTLGILYSLIRK
jgi:hypothetical protein